MCEREFDEYLTVPQAAKLTGLPMWLLYREHDRKNIEFDRLRGCSKGYRIRRSELERWLAAEMLPA